MTAGRGIRGLIPKEISGMAKYTVPEPEAGGARAADFVDRLIAAKAFESGAMETRMGLRNYTKAKVHEIAENDEVVDVDTVVFFWDVVRSTLDKHKNEWIVGRVIKPENSRAYLWSKPDEAEIPFIDRAMNHIEDGQPTAE